MTTLTPRSRRSNAGLRRPVETGARCWTACVEASPDGGLAVRRRDRLVSLQVAASCLVRPSPGDTIVYCGSDRSGLWVLSVLERADRASPQVLECRGDTQIRVTGGALAIDARDLHMTASSLALRADTLTVSADSGEIVGDRLRIVAGTFKVVGQLLSTVMDRVNHFSRHYLRRTEGMDRVSATHVECEADQLLHLRGDHALINGARLVKARGAQIHFG